MKYRLKDYPDIRNRIEQMSVRELLKAVSCPQNRADDFSLEKGYSFVFLHETTKEKAEEFINFYGIDTVLVSDTECGAGEMIEGCELFPSMRALGKIGDSELAYKVGRVTAKDCRNVGYRWSFSPVVDILFNHESPMASTRTAGDDAETVISIAGAYMKGMQDGGLAATIKHFPGDGATTYDQHITTEKNPLSFDEWMDSYGRVYKALIEQGAMSVMPGHISLPAYDDPDPKLGLCPPATLSRKLMADLLRGELGFEGIIVSDAVTMSGFSGFMNYYEACATFLKNGGDILLFARTDDRYYTNMQNLVESGFLPLDILKDRAYRVQCFARYILSEYTPVDSMEINARELSNEVVERSMEVVRDRADILPITSGKEKKFLVVDMSNVYDGSANSQKFFDSLKDKGYNVDFLCDPGSEKLAELAEDTGYDYIICTVDNGFAFGTNVLRLHGLTARNMMDGWTRMGTPVVFICFRHPYFHEQFEALADTAINCYGTAAATNDQLESILFL